MSLYSVLFLLTFCKYTISMENSNNIPIVLWHEIGTNYLDTRGLEKALKRVLDGVYILSLKIGPTAIDDIYNSMLMHPDKQVKIACDIVTSDSQLRDGFNAIGLSQGSLFLRALVQRCDGAKVKNLITLGGQHQGVYGIPFCPKLLYHKCDLLRKLISFAAYKRFVQNLFVEATYWHDPIHENDYIRGSTFLADINNERLFNTSYIYRLLALENFVMVRFEKDRIVQPVATQWFGYYDKGQSVKILQLNESKIYINDRLGLKRMDSQNKLHFLSVPGEHLQYDWKWFEETIVRKFLM